MLEKLSPIESTRLFEDRAHPRLSYYYSSTYLGASGLTEFVLGFLTSHLLACPALCSLMRYSTLY